MTASFAKYPLYSAAVLIWLIPVAALLPAALSRFQAGIAYERAFPVPAYLAMNVEVPRSAYLGAAGAMRPSTMRDGNAAWVAGKALLHAGHYKDSQDLLVAALQRAPAMTRAWTALSTAKSKENPQSAAVDLEMALLLSHYEYHVAGQRARNAALLWEYLSENAQTAALAQVRLLWTEPILRMELVLLLQAPNGPEIIQRAFSEQPDELRSLNRWVAALGRRGRI